MTSDAKPEVPPPATDPWKGLRGVMAGTLVLEAITVLLALPVISAVGGGLRWWSVLYVVGLAVIMFLGAGLQRRPWAIPFNLALQVALLLGGFIHLSILVIGVVFVAVWIFVLFLRADVKKRMEAGILPSQRMSGA
ncbi:DUF4233 domain-containing protein [Nocardia seriolae]|uniref:Membrane protein n=1 Tax=Nocardia seriolae TaxID=37332 RepID=A0ABC9YQ20_9NOCA|nr:DUF4233 domain-containing protein [Nocardia seriolae]APB00893.1 hypothetical protein NS506_06862 [Nocardia seriolae]OJF82184.1 hypothetical protein NS14008_27275 [Nocardia seriolae]QOW33721.1 DUF4233 domain-containing protein [Nocardia seriolae]QUN14840.1 DUF4233 domain-containing protein [Nocardia seriolae]WKY54121.1 DUF4233 domain-containing protein [Nocardia seriolae]